MTIADWLMIVAVLVSPVIAVQVQKAIEKWREGRHRKRMIFQTLMSTRGSILSPAHVGALNLIDLEFSANRPKQKKVLDAWKEYLDHLCTPKRDPDRWLTEAGERLVDLLDAMGTSVGYGFDKVHLKKQFYAPQAYADLELDQSDIRNRTLELLSGKRSLPVEITIRAKTPDRTNESKPAKTPDGTNESKKPS